MGAVVSTIRHGDEELAVSAGADGGAAGLSAGLVEQALKEAGQSAVGLRGGGTRRLLPPLTCGTYLVDRPWWKSCGGRGWGSTHRTWRLLALKFAQASGVNAYIVDR